MYVNAGFNEAVAVTTDKFNVVALPPPEVVPDEVPARFVVAVGALCTTCPEADNPASPGCVVIVADAPVLVCVFCCIFADVYPIILPQ